MVEFSLARFARFSRKISSSRERILPISLAFEWCNAGMRDAQYIVARKDSAKRTSRFTILADGYILQTFHNLGFYCAYTQTRRKMAVATPICRSVIHLFRSVATCTNVVTGKFEHGVMFTRLDFQKLTHAPYNESANWCNINAWGVHRTVTVARKLRYNRNRPFGSQPPMI